MEIRAVRNSLKKFEKLSVAQLAQVTGERKDDLQFVLQDWVNQNKVEELTELVSSFDCGGCSCGSGSCETSSMDEEKFYRWISK